SGARWILRRSGPGGPSCPAGSSPRCLPLSGTSWPSTGSVIGSAPSGTPSRLIVFRGGGEMASAAVRLCFLSGFRVVVLEQERPLAVRRRVCFAEAVLAGSIEVEGVRGEKVLLERLSAAGPGFVEVTIDPEGRA